MRVKRRALLLLCVWMTLIAAMGSFAAQAQAVSGGVTFKETVDEGIQPNAVEIPILMYHDLVEEAGDSSISRDIMWVGQFRRQMELLLDHGFEPISFDQLIAFCKEGEELPQKPVIVTFDDRYSSFYELAFPILKELSIQATVFPIGVSVGKDTYKDTGISMIPHFDWQQAQEMASSGLVSIQSHSYDMHQWAPYEAGNPEVRMTAVQQPWETDTEYALAFQLDLTKSRQDIYLAIGMKPVVYSYPSGAHTERSEELLTEAGIECSVTIQGGKAQVRPGVPESLYGLNRFYITPDVTDEKFLEMVK